MNQYPLVTVTCVRDLPLFELQAQSMSLYAPDNADIIIIVNEQDPTEWNDYFNTHIRHYYSRHNLTVKYLSDFLLDIQSSDGWDIQQTLKIVIGRRGINADRYLVLDSQNFLIKPLYYLQHPVKDGLVPFRTGEFVMPWTIWRNYARALELESFHPPEDAMSMCTPLWFKTDLIKSLIREHGNEYGFSKWFNEVSKIKSEFMLYYLWGEKQGGFRKHHYRIGDWAGPYLRDGIDFDKDVEKFLLEAGASIFIPFTSINFRAWGEMGEAQYTQVCEKLQQFGLTPNFEEFRKTYS